MYGITSNIDELVQKFQVLKLAAEQTDFSEALLVGVNAAKAAMQNRIFNQGLDSNGVSLGAYKGNQSKRFIQKIFKDQNVKKRIIGNRGQFTPYELKRIKAGRQVLYKDLEFTGDLRRAIKVLREGNTRVVCAIPNNNLFLLSTYQEKQLLTKIFSPSAEENELLTLNTNAALKQQYDRLLNP